MVSPWKGTCSFVLVSFCQYCYLYHIIKINGTLPYPLVIVIYAQTSLTTNVWDLTALHPTTEAFDTPTPQANWNRYVGNELLDAEEYGDFHLVVIPYQLQDISGICIWLISMLIGMLLLLGWPTQSRDGISFCALIELWMWR